MRSSSSTETPTLEKRIQVLERQNKRVAGFSFCLLVLLGLSASSPSKPKDLEAKSLQIVDQKGKVRLSLSVTDEGPKLALSDAEGRERLLMNLDEEGWGDLRMLDPRGRNRAIVRTRANHSMFYALDPTGRGGAVMSTNETSSDVTLYDNQSIPQVRGRWQVHQQRGTESRPITMTLWDEGHKVVHEISSDSE